MTTPPMPATVELPAGAKHDGIVAVAAVQVERAGRRALQEDRVASSMPLTVKFLDPAIGEAAARAEQIIAGCGADLVEVIVKVLDAVSLRSSTSSALLPLPASMIKELRISLTSPVGLPGVLSTIMLSMPAPGLMLVVAPAAVPSTWIWLFPDPSFSVRDARPV